MTLTTTALSDRNRVPEQILQGDCGKYRQFLETAERQDEFAVLSLAC